MAADINVLDRQNLTMIPEIVLYNVVEAILEEISNDYKRSVDPQTSLLYEMFYGLKEDKRDYYLEAVDLFVRKKDHPRRIKLRQSFDSSVGGVPCIHITTPSDDRGENSIGVGESGMEGFSREIKEEKRIRPFLEQRFDSRYAIMCTSENASEALMIYHVVRDFMIGIMDILEFAGFSNIKLSGREIRIVTENAPVHLFAREITFATSVDIRVPKFHSYKKITDIVLNRGEIIDDPTQE